LNFDADFIVDACKRGDGDLGSLEIQCPALEKDPERQRCNIPIPKYPMVIPLIHIHSSPSSPSSYVL
jgi:hypothetical protein